MATPDLDRLADEVWARKTGAPLPVGNGASTINLDAAADAAWAKRTGVQQAPARDPSKGPGTTIASIGRTGDWQTAEDRTIQPRPLVREKTGSLSDIARTLPERARESALGGPVFAPKVGITPEQREKNRAAAFKRFGLAAMPDPAGVPGMPRVWAEAQEEDRAKRRTIPVIDKASDIAATAIGEAQKVKDWPTVGEALSRSAITGAQMLQGIPSLIGNVGGAVAASPVALINKGLEAVGVPKGEGVFGNLPQKWVDEGTAAAEGMAAAVPQSLGRVIGGAINPKALVQDPLQTTADVATVAAPAAIGAGVARGAAAARGAGLGARVGSAVSEGMRGLGSPTAGVSEGLLRGAAQNIGRARAAISPIRTGADVAVTPGIGSAALEVGKAGAKAAGAVALDNLLGGATSLPNAPMVPLRAIGAVAKMTPRGRKALLTEEQLTARAGDALRDADSRLPDVRTRRQIADETWQREVDPVLGRMTKVAPALEENQFAIGARVSETGKPITRPRGAGPRDSRIMYQPIGTRQPVPMSRGTLEAEPGVLTGKRGAGVGGVQRDAPGRSIGRPIEPDTFEVRPEDIVAERTTRAAAPKDVEVATARINKIRADNYDELVQYGKAVEDWEYEMRVAQSVSHMDWNHPAVQAVAAKEPVAPKAWHELQKAKEALWRAERAAAGHVVDARPVGATTPVAPSLTETFTPTRGIGAPISKARAFFTPKNGPPVIANAGQVYKASTEPAGGFVRIMDKDGFVATEHEMLPGVRGGERNLTPEAAGDLYQNYLNNPGARIDIEVSGLPPTPAGAPAPAAVIVGKVGSMQAQLLFEAMRLSKMPKETAAAMVVKWLPHIKKYTRTPPVGRDLFPGGVQSVVKSITEQRKAKQHINSPENWLRTNAAQASEMVNNVATLSVANRWLELAAERAAQGAGKSKGWRTVSFKGMPPEAVSLVEHHLGGVGAPGKFRQSQRQVPAAVADQIEALLGRQNRGWTRTLGDTPLGRGAQTLHNSYVTNQLMLLPTSAVNNMLSALTQAAPAAMKHGLADYPVQLFKTMKEYANLKGNRRGFLGDEAPAFMMPDNPVLDFGNGRSIRRYQLIQELGGETAYGIEAQGALQTPGRVLSTIGEKGGKVGKAVAEKAGAAKEVGRWYVEWGQQQYGTGFLSDMAAKEALITSYLKKYPKASIADGIQFAESYLLAYHKMPDFPRQLSATWVPFFNWTWGATPVTLRALGDFPAFFNALSVAADAAELERATRDNVDPKRLSEVVPGYMQTSSFSGLTGDPGVVEMGDVSRKTTHTMATQAMVDMASGGFEPGMLARRTGRGVVAPIIAGAVNTAELLGHDPREFATGKRIYRRENEPWENALSAARATVGPFVVPSGASRFIGEAVDRVRGKPVTYPTGPEKGWAESALRLPIGAISTKVDLGELQERRIGQITAEQGEIRSVRNAKRRELDKRRDLGLVDADEYVAEAARIDDEERAALAEAEIRERSAQTGRGILSPTARIRKPGIVRFPPRPDAIFQPRRQQ